MRPRIRTLLGERTPLIFLSLAIATALWFFVRDTARQVTVPGRPGAIMKTVPVVPSVVGAPAEGFSVRGIEVRPSAVTLTGPKDIMDGIDVVPTTPVRIEGAQHDVEQTVDLRVPPGILTQGAVSVTVRIGRLLARSLLTGVPVRIDGLRDGMNATVEPGAVTVEVEGPAELVGGMLAGDVLVQVNLTGLGPGTHSARPNVRIVGTEVRIVGTQPRTVTVRIRRT